MTTKISAFLITRNEAHDIALCLKSLSGVADEIVVVDDGSQDDTLLICKQYGARVFERTLVGFGAQKQFALEQTTGEWVLSVDADERLTPELADEIRSVVEKPLASGYAIHRRFFFLGHSLKHGGIGKDWVVRLFRRDSGRFSSVPVHERIDIQGPIHRLSSDLLHFSYNSLYEYVEKSNRYSELSARELFQSGRRFSWTDHLRPVWEVFSRIVLRNAWLDGRPGIIYAALSAHTAWLRAVKLWGLEQKENQT